jgi:hypothetical protein
MSSLERKAAIFQSNRYQDPYEVTGSFVLAGATVTIPVFGGHIQSVTRIANATPTIAFRVQLLEQLPGLGKGHQAFSAGGDPRLVIEAFARGPNGAANGTQIYAVNVLETGINPAVASPAFVTGRDIDIIVFQSAVAGANLGAAVDTAGIIVSFTIKGARVPVRT